MTEKKWTNEKVEKEVKDFINANFFLSDRLKDFDPDSSLMAAGIIDSTGILELIEFLEERFEVQVINGDITPENLDSLKSIGKFVIRKIDSNNGAD